jgi:hypothetical protein
VTDQIAGLRRKSTGHEKTKANCNSRRRRPLPALQRADAKYANPTASVTGSGISGFFYTRWFCCLNKQCKTTLVMPARYKVTNVG